MYVFILSKRLSKSAVVTEETLALEATMGASEFASAAVAAAYVSGTCLNLLALLGAMNSSPSWGLYLLSNSLAYAALLQEEMESICYPMMPAGRESTNTLL